MTKIDKTDWGYVPTDPDPDFDAEKNQRKVDELIRKHENVRAKKLREWKEKARERTDAVARFVKSDTEKDPEGYFGKKYLNYLKGQEFMAKLNYAKKQKERKDREDKV